MAAKTQSAPRRGAVHDMTTGNPMSLILGFALPLLGGMLFQQFYSMVDTLIVGRFLGIDALAGVGSTQPISFMIIGFCMGVCSGFAIPISQRFGAEDYAGMRRFLSHSFYLCGLFSIGLTTLVCLLCTHILTWMNTPEDIFEYAFRYIFIIFLGIPATLLFNITSGAIRALGDSRAPVIFLLISSVINIGLDLILIVIIPLGVAGAAIATVVAQLVSGIICLLYMFRKIEILRIQREEWTPSAHYFSVLMAMGIPMGLQYSITAIGSIILQTAVNGLGAVYVAAQTAGSKVIMFFGVPYEAIGATMATYGGQNVGAGKPERLNPGLKAASVLGLSYAVAAAVVLFLFGRPLTALFLDAPTEEILYNGWLFLAVNSAFYFLLHFVNGVRFLIQGMGFSAFAIIAGIAEMIGRTVAAWILIPIVGYLGACLASPVAWVCADLFLIPAYFHVRRRVIRSLENGSGQF